MGPKHFLELQDFDKATLDGIVARARTIKQARVGKPKGWLDANKPLVGKAVALIFQRPSTRTRVSFEMAVRQLGGEVFTLAAHEMQLGRGETIADTARVLSRYVDCIMLRAAEPGQMEALANAATVPVINGLTPLSHPCQVMADMMTLEEHKGAIAKQKIAWVGDGNNVAASWVQAVAVMGGELTLACPDMYRPDDATMELVHRNRDRISVVSAPEEAVRNADCVITDAWVSMHDQDGEKRHNILAPYQVNGRLMKHAKADAIFMHCLPAHRNEEVTDEVMDSAQSVVFDEAENRLHVQKSILLHCLGFA
jgi:ornithine carbamoyltransferase